VKSRLQNHPLAQQVYARILSTLGHWHAKNEHFYQAIDCCCRAYRRIPDSAVRQKQLHGIHCVLQSACCSEAQLLPIRRNRILDQFQQLPECSSIRDMLLQRPFHDRIRLRQPRPDDDPRRQGCLILLKRPNPRIGERGVILLKYLYSFAEFPALFDLRRVADQYQIVLEPSWTGYAEAPFFLYVGADLDVLIQCTQPDDARFFDQLNVNFRTVPLGGGDWVDYDLFRPIPDSVRDYDVAMVASWTPWKRHDVLFRALAKLKPRCQPRVALIGAGTGAERKIIERQMEVIGIRSQCEIFERVPAATVANILARSKVAILLSKLEGTNKGIHEALFCDTPVIVYRHHIGLNMRTVNPMTGILADDHELSDAIENMISAPQAFQPRSWALANTGYCRSTNQINTMLREMALQRGNPWTIDIVPKVNRPHAQYKLEEDRIAFEPLFDGLAGFLRD
jgi:glycosyltransferase involved in cell wall biosynthesis